MNLEIPKRTNMHQRNNTSFLNYKSNIVDRTKIEIVQEPLLEADTEEQGFDLNLSQNVGDKIERLENPYEENAVSHLNISMNSSYFNPPSEDDKVRKIKVKSKKPVVEFENESDAAEFKNMLEDCCKCVFGIIVICFFFMKF